MKNSDIIKHPVVYLDIIVLSTLNSDIIVTVTDVYVHDHNHVVSTSIHDIQAGTQR